MRRDLTKQQLLLADYMSEISERCYNAGWMQHLEYVLWGAVQIGERRYGHDSITKEDIKTLKKLSNDAGSWILFHDETDEMAIDLEEWKERFRYDIQKKPGLLKG